MATSMVFFGYGGFAAMTVNSCESATCETEVYQALEYAAIVGLVSLVGSVGLAIYRQRPPLLYFALIGYAIAYLFATSAIDKALGR